METDLFWQCTIRLHDEDLWGTGSRAHKGDTATVGRKEQGFPLDEWHARLLLNWPAGQVLTGGRPN